MHEQTRSFAWSFVRKSSRSNFIYDYQLSKARRKFNDEVLALKVQYWYRQPSSFPLVTILTVPRLRTAYNFAWLAANDIKGQQVATGT